VADPFATPPAKLQLPVEVIGADVHGQQFFERTLTIAICRTGVSVLLDKKMGPDAEVILRNPETNEEAIAFVVGQIPEDKTGHVYGLTFLDPSVNLWRVQFPAAEEARLVQLECSGCRSVKALSLSDIELEILKAKQELTRSCDNCKSFMTWRETSREPTEKKAKISPKENLNPPIVAYPAEERRRNRRSELKGVACIRHSGLEVIVACEDISKGGFRFTSHKEYPKGTRVEAAAPYTKFSTNIFTSAAVIYSHKIPNGKFRHGVAYLKNTRQIGWNS
jgi:hypothetical protein